MITKLFYRIWLIAFPIIVFGQCGSLCANDGFYFGAGLNYACVVSSPGGNGAYSSNYTNGSGILMELGYDACSKYGYHIGVQTVGFNTRRFSSYGQNFENGPTLIKSLAGFHLRVTDRVPVEVFANVTFNSYKNIHSKEYSYNTSQGVVYLWGSEDQREGGVIGCDFGSKIKLYKGLWSSVAYQYLKLNHDKVGVNSMHIVDIGLIYQWGK